MENKPFSVLPRTLLLALCGLLLGGCGLKIAPPFLGVALDGYPVTSQKLESVTREFPVPPEIVLFYLQWPSVSKTNDFPFSTLDDIWNAGAVACLTWEPMYYEGSNEETIQHRSILDGSYDPYITAFAVQAKKWGKPFIIRFAHEMNLSRYHWGTTKEQYGVESPELYKKMYRHVVDIFRREGANNVLWAFAPNAESVPDAGYDTSAGWNRIGNYYPGNEYVDILGIDGYNWGTSKTIVKDGWDSRWLTFKELFRTPLHELRELSDSKPIIIFETASTGQGGDKNSWFREALITAEEWGIAGVVWFQVDKEEEWKIGKKIFPDLPPQRKEVGAQEWFQRIIGAKR